MPFALASYDSGYIHNLYSVDVFHLVQYLTCAESTYNTSYIHMQTRLTLSQNCFSCVRFLFRMNVRMKQSPLEHQTYDI